MRLVAPPTVSYNNDASESRWRYANVRIDLEGEKLVNGKILRYIDNDGMGFEGIPYSRGPGQTQFILHGLIPLSVDEDGYLECHVGRVDALDYLEGRI